MLPIQQQLLTFLTNLIPNNERPTIEDSRLSAYDEKIRQWENLLDDIAHQLRDEFADDDRTIAQLSVLNFAQFAQTTET